MKMLLDSSHKRSGSGEGIRSNMLFRRTEATKEQRSPRDHATYLSGGQHRAVPVGATRGKLCPRADFTVAIGKHTWGYATYLLTLYTTFTLIVCTFCHRISGWVRTTTHSGLQLSQQ